MEGIEAICFQLISYVGSAKSCYMEAIEAIEKNDFASVDAFMKEGDKQLQEGHAIHFELIQKEANKEDIPLCLLLLHAEDQLMSAETIKIMAERVLHIYERLDTQRGQLYDEC